MRAKNREINIFNISLLDVLTGMLGAFLFLMLGLVPYYSKQISGVTISEEDKRKFDELKKLLEKGLKGPLTPEEVAQLQAELTRLQSENQQLAAQNSQLQAQIDQLQNQVNQVTAQLDQATKDRDFWQNQNATISIVSLWDSEDTDVDVMVLTPDGRVIGHKEGETVLGRQVSKTGCDSHIGNFKSSTESLVLYTSLYGGGDYLIFYRVPRNGNPANYVNLLGFYEYHETLSTSGNTMNIEYALLDAHGASAKPGGLYAWTVLHFDPTTHDVQRKNPDPSNLPPGIVMPP